MPDANGHFRGISVNAEAWERIFGANEMVCVGGPLGGRRFSGTFVGPRLRFPDHDRYDGEYRLSYSSVNGRSHVYEWHQS